MKHRLIVFCAVLLTAGCCPTQRELRARAGELCAYIPYESVPYKSRGELTEDFCAALDLLFSLPDDPDILRESEFWFVAADGSPVAVCTCEAVSVRLTDKTHAVAVVRVQPPDEDYDAEEHNLTMERGDGKWLLSDYDGCKAACRKYLQ